MTTSADTKVKLWNSSNNWNLLGTYTAHSAVVYSLIYLSNDVIASGDSNGMIYMWSITSLTTISTINVDSAVDSLARLNNGFHLASGHSTGSIKIWNIIDGSLITTLLGHSNCVYDLVVISDDLLAS